MSDFNPADFDKSADLKGLQEDIAKAGEGQGSYKEVPKDDTYEVSLKSLEIRTVANESSKNFGQPMIMMIFNVVAGEYEGETIPYFQVIGGAHAGIGISVAKKLLKSLESEHEVTFESYSQFNDLLLDIAEDIEAKKYEYALEYTSNKKNPRFADYKITEVFTPEKAAA